MGREVKITWVWATMDRGFNIPWIGGQNTMGRVFNIPWIGGSIYHG
jgi:hypothetical protein